MTEHLMLIEATITYGAIDASVAITTGTIANSIALIEPELDSIAEISSTATLALRLTRRDTPRTPGVR